MFVILIVVMGGSFKMVKLTKARTGGTRDSGQPVWKCSKCHKQFQTKALAIQHERRKHGVKKW